MDVQTEGSVEGQSQQAGEGQQTDVDPLRNIKEEFSRKHGNLESSIEELKRQNEALIQQLQAGSGQQSAKQEPVADIDDLMYSNPAEYRRLLEEQLTNKITSKINETQTKKEQIESAKQQTIVKLIQEFPELNQPGSELYQEAVGIINKLPKDQQSSPIAYEAAVYQAAMKKGVNPMSQRKNQSSQQDSFQMSGSKTPPTTKKKGPEAEVDEKALEFARHVLGKEPDEAFVKELAKNSKRKNWVRYQ